MSNVDINDVKNIVLESLDNLKTQNIVMIDVSKKEVTHRKALAVGEIILGAEIIKLINIRKLFKNLLVLELTNNSFEVKDDFFFTYNIIAGIRLFYLMYKFQKEGKRNQNIIQCL